MQCKKCKIQVNNLIKHLSRNRCAHQHKDAINSSKYHNRSRLPFDARLPYHRLKVTPEKSKNNQ